MKVKELAAEIVATRDKVNAESNTNELIYLMGYMDALRWAWRKETR